MQGCIHGEVSCKYLYFLMFLDVYRLVGLMITAYSFFLGNTINIKISWNEHYRQLIVSSEQYLVSQAAAAAALRLQGLHRSMGKWTALRLQGLRWFMAKLTTQAVVHLPSIAQEVIKIPLLHMMFYIFGQALWLQIVVFWCWIFIFTIYSYHF